jgi:hypothetical protein
MTFAGQRLLTNGKYVPGSAVNAFEYRIGTTELPSFICELRGCGGIGLRYLAAIDGLFRTKLQGRHQRTYDHDAFGGASGARCGRSPGAPKAPREYAEVPATGIGASGRSLGGGYRLSRRSRSGSRRCGLLRPFTRGRMAVPPCARPAGPWTLGAQGMRNPH